MHELDTGDTSLLLPANCPYQAYLTPAAVWAVQPPSQYAATAFCAPAPVPQTSAPITNYERGVSQRKVPGKDVSGKPAPTQACSPKLPRTHASQYYAEAPSTNASALLRAALNQI